MNPKEANLNGNDSTSIVHLKEGLLLLNIQTFVAFDIIIVDDLPIVLANWHLRCVHKQIKEGKAKR